MITSDIVTGGGMFIQEGTTASTISVVVWQLGFLPLIVIVRVRTEDTNPLSVDRMRRDRFPKYSLPGYENLSRIRHCSKVMPQKLQPINLK